MESSSGAASSSAAAPRSPASWSPASHSPALRSPAPRSPAPRSPAPRSPAHRIATPETPTAPRSVTPSNPQSAVTATVPLAGASPGRRSGKSTGAGVAPVSPGRAAGPAVAAVAAGPADAGGQTGAVGQAESAVAAGQAGPAEAAGQAGPAGATARDKRGAGQSPRHRITPRFPRPDPAARNDGTGASDANKVIVCDYPGYTQTQDLLRIFSKIGNVKVELINPKCSILTYPTAAEAAAALELNKMKTIYGCFVTVKPYNEQILLEEGRRAMRKEYKKIKRKVPTIDPAKLDLSGEFLQQLDNMLGSVRFNQEQVAALSRLYVDVEQVMQTLWPGCTAFPFGSITTGLGIKSSDADCFVNVPPKFRHPNANFVTKAKRLLQQHPNTFTEILSIPRANTPIVKFYHVPTETYCDLTFKTPLGAQNSKLIAFLLHSDPRLIPMAVLLKYWAKVHDLSGTGKLTNYALTMMIIFYFQQPHVAILPSVFWLQRDSANDYIVDFWNTGFMCKKEFFPVTNNRAGIADLLGGFFEYYSLFNFDDLIVCPYLGFPIKRIVFRDLYGIPKEFERYCNNVLQGNVMPLRLNTAMCVQDPFEQSHNIASAITPQLAADLRVYFKFAATAYEQEKPNNYREFLKTILLKKPKLLRNKSLPEFRVNLFPRIIAVIDSPDWKATVREILFTIFEKMLKIKLGKVEEKVSPDTMKEKEKYSGLVTKEIWKRKQLTKLYSIVNLTFEEKQKRITEEIMNIDQNNINIMFQLLVTFSHEPRSVVLSLRCLSEDGDDSYREFGKFFLSIAQTWFIHHLGILYGTKGEKDKLDIQESDPNECADSDDDSPSSSDARKETDNPEESLTKPSPTASSPITPPPTDDHEDSPAPPSLDIQ